MFQIAQKRPLAQFDGQGATPAADRWPNRAHGHRCAIVGRSTANRTPPADPPSFPLMFPDTHVEWQPGTYQHQHSLYSLFAYIYPPFYRERVYIHKGMRLAFYVRVRVNQGG